jgi:hypothetical protein
VPVYALPELYILGNEQENHKIEFASVNIARRASTGLARDGLLLYQVEGYFEWHLPRGRSLIFAISYYCGATSLDNVRKLPRRKARRAGLNQATRQVAMRAQ